MKHASSPPKPVALSKEELQSRYNSERISYPDGKPDNHLSWIHRPTYVGGDLAYRGQIQKKVVTLTSS
jgi:hypothetical protein